MPVSGGGEFFPSCWVRLIIRFEDFGAKDVPQTPKTPPTARKGQGGAAPALNVTEQNGILVLTSGSESTQFGPPTAQQLSADGRTQSIDCVVPVDASWFQNGLMKADTLSFSVRYKDVPIDPRVVRACAVEFFAGTILPAEFERGTRGEVRDSSDGGPNSHLPYSVCPRTYNGNQSNLRFQGWVDSWEVDWPERGEPLVNFECTDTTRIVIDLPAPPNLVIAADKPIDRAVADYLSHFPQMLGIGVAYRPAGLEIPSLSSVVKGARAFVPAGGGPNNKLAVWHYIVDVCRAMGHSPRFDIVVGAGGVGIPTIVIQRARTLYNSTLPSRSEDPFDDSEKKRRGRAADRTINNRVMIYGRNILTMKVVRNYKYAPTNVEVRAYDDARKKMIVARFPEKGDRLSHPSPGDQSDQKFAVIVLQIPVTDTKVLKMLAQEVYEMVGRREIQFEIGTKNLASFGGDNESPDLFDMRTGDAIDVEMARQMAGTADEPVMSTSNIIADQRVSQPRQHLLNLGFSDKFAAAHEKAINNIAFQRTFRLLESRMDWDSAEDGGITFTLSTGNYTEIRADKKLPEELEPTVKAVTGAKRNPSTVKDPGAKAPAGGGKDKAVSD